MRRGARVNSTGFVLHALRMKRNYRSEPMTQNSIVETLIGAAVIAVAALFLVFAYSSTGSGPVSGYDVVAKFNRADGVNIGTDVRLSGIKVGTVQKLALD